MELTAEQHSEINRLKKLELKRRSIPWAIDVWTGNELKKFFEQQTRDYEKTREKEKLRAEEYRKSQEKIKKKKRRGDRKT